MPVNDPSQSALPNTSWQGLLLADLGAPVSNSNLAAISLWAQSEGVTGSNNPLAISGNPLGLPTSGCIAQCGSSSPIYGYNTMADGIANTAAFLQGSNYSGLVKALQGDAGLNAIFTAINQSGWCSGCQNGQYPVDLFQALSNSTTAINNAVAQLVLDIPGTSIQIPGTSGVPNPIGSAASALGEFSTIATKLSSYQFWLRVGEFTLGLGLLVGGLALFVATSKEGEKAIGTAADVAPLLAA